MITELIYEAPNGAKVESHKRVNERPAFLLAKCDGLESMPDVTSDMEDTYGVPGSAWQGVTIGTRSVSASIYTASLDALGLNLLNDRISRACFPSNGLGVLRATTDTGNRYRIAAKCVDSSVSDSRRSGALHSLTFECPQPFMESDFEYITELVNYDGGKEWPLQRSYTFANTLVSQNTIEKRVKNDGDMYTPVLVRFLCDNMTQATLENLTTGARLAIDTGGESINELLINTDYDNPYVKMQQYSSSEYINAAPYVDAQEDISDFMLAPGYNDLKLTTNATGITIAGSVITYRERFTICR